MDLKSQPKGASTLKGQPTVCGTPKENPVGVAGDEDMNRFVQMSLSGLVDTCCRDHLSGKHQASNFS